MSAAQDCEVALQELRDGLAQVTRTRACDWYPVFKARQGMAVAFSVLRRARPERPRVATQLLTCCTAVDPILWAGLEPMYGDVLPQTLALDPACAPVDDATGAVVLQHTFGIMDPRTDGALAREARRAGALVLEDCAHCVGRLGLDDHGRPLADVSVHSFGVEKLLPTHFGGAVWLNPSMADGALRQQLAAALTALPELEPARARAARSYLNQMRVLNHAPAGMGQKLKQLWERGGAFEPAIAPEEREGSLASEPALPSAWVAHKAAHALGGLESSFRRREETVQGYARALAQLPREPGHGAWAPQGGWNPAQPLLRQGLFFEDPEAGAQALARARAQGLYAVPWYRPVLFPGVTNPAAYGLPDGVEAVLAALPVTRACAQGPVALPCDIGPEAAEKAVRATLG